MDIEQTILQYNGYDVDIPLAFVILRRLDQYVSHENLDLIQLKANNFLNDIYRSYICICFPANLIAAASLFMSLLFLKIDLSTLTFLFETNEMQSESDMKTDMSQFPFQELFGVEASDVFSLAQLSYHFIKIIK